MTTPLKRVILTTAVAAAVPLLGVAIAGSVFHISVPTMTRDVSALAKIHPLTGVLSSLGILFWWTSATIYLFTAFLQRERKEATEIGFLIYSGLLSIYLGFDDLFLIHEYLAPIYLKIPERAVYLLIAFATLVYLVRYGRLLRRPDGVLLLCALACLSGSVAIDAVFAPWLKVMGGWDVFIEDGLKWLGICFWTAFCIVRSSAILRSVAQNETCELGTAMPS